MIDFVLDIFGFLLKTLIVVGVVIIPIVVLLLSARKKDNKGENLSEGVSSLVTVDLKKLFAKRHKLMTKTNCENRNISVINLADLFDEDRINLTTD